MLYRTKAKVTTDDAIVNKRATLVINEKQEGLISLPVPQAVVTEVTSKMLSGSKGMPYDWISMMEDCISINEMCPIICEKVLTYWKDLEPVRRTKKVHIRLVGYNI